MSALLLLLAALGVFALSGRVRLAAERQDLTAQTLREADLLLAGSPPGLRNDRALVEQTTLATPDEEPLADAVRSIVSSIGLESSLLVVSDAAESDGASSATSLSVGPTTPDGVLLDEAREGLGLDADADALEPVVILVKVRGPVSSIAAMLELLERSEKALSLSRVIVMPVAEEVEVTVAVAGVHFSAPSPSQRVALARIERSEEGG